MGTPLRALIVEDSQDDAELLRLAIEQGGYTVTSERVETPEGLTDALERAQWDVILSDYNMPAFTGLQGFEMLKETGLDIPFIIVSGSIGEEVAVNAMKAGVHDYVLKDNLVRLNETIRRELSEARSRRARREAEAALARSNAQNRALLDAIPDSISRVRSDGTFLDCISCQNNPPFRPEEAIGKTIMQVFPPDVASRCLGAIEQALETGEAQVCENTFETPAGAHTYEMRVSPCGPGEALMIARDITELRSLEEQMRGAQKMEAIGRLAGGIAHDFMNLLSVIMGYSELILAKSSVPNQLRESIEQIRYAGERATSLTQQLLAFSRKQVLQPEVLDLNVVVKRMDAMLRRLIGEDIDLVTNCAPAIDPVKMDPGKVEQIIMNLAINARDAMPGGGKLTIETANVELDEHYARTHAATNPGPHVLLAITDTGVGMDAETRARIFEPFFTTKEVGKGTGLGLSTVYGIVKQSGGNIWVYSEPGRGTTLKVYLPRAEEAVLPPTPPSEPAPRQGTETILVVEDQQDVRTLITNVLEMEGYVVLATGDADEAIEICKTHAETISLVLTDVIMPKMSGRQLAEALVALLPDLKVLYMSGYTHDAIMHQGVLDPGVSFYEKPIRPFTLLEKVREVLSN